MAATPTDLDSFGSYLRGPQSDSEPYALEQYKPFQGQSCSR